MATSQQTKIKTTTKMSLATVVTIQRITMTTLIQVWNAMTILGNYQRTRLSFTMTSSLKPKKKRIQPRWILRLTYIFLLLFMACLYTTLHIFLHLFYTIMYLICPLPSLQVNIFQLHLDDFVWKHINNCFTIGARFVSCLSLFDVLHLFFCLFPHLSSLFLIIFS